ncbi:zinc-binding dehydrogenase [Rhodococcus qingshengii]|uniref:zinc-binding dehydrogenase n=1 Tax=Rhodococcus qingshengii TaxID=334542 RepID=UPI0028F2927B|nr:zinc-binding dehydrogenase [Rhodococcus qingshengii]MDT9664798.1 zinc-binding dehydrogenase [Rhodococcus qingshengii]
MTSTEPLDISAEGTVPDETTAAIWRGDASITLEKLPIPILGAGEALVRIDLATVCGSDRHTVSGRRQQPCPSILGHETVGTLIAKSGRVVAIDGTELRLGQRLVWSVTFPCGSCDRCARGFTAKCRQVRKAGHEALDSGWALSGGYAEHVLLPSGMPIAVVDDDLPDELAAPAACATATVMAVAERAGDLSGKRITIIGAGMLGLTAAAVAADAGAAAVVSIDVSDERRVLATQFGATRSVDSVSEAGTTDVLLEFSGSRAALQQGLALLDIGGTAVLAGSVAPDGLLQIDPESIVRNDTTVQGQHNYEPRHLVSALEFLARTARVFPWMQLVAPAKPMSELPRLLTGAPGLAPREAIRPW